MDDDDDSPTSNKRTLAEEEGDNWLKPPPKDNGELDESNDVTVREPKRAKIMTDASSQKRGKRMFGVLMGTLTKFRDEGSKQTDAAKRRSALEERLASKLRAETLELERKNDRIRQEKQLRFDTLRKSDERSTLDLIYQNRHDAALFLSRYLCTSHIPPVALSTSGVRPPVCPELPLSLGPTASGQKPIYYLPARLLDSQRDLLDAQIDRVRVTIERERNEWETERAKRDREISDLKDKRNEFHEPRPAADEASVGDIRMRDSSVAASARAEGEGELDDRRSPGATSATAAEDMGY